MPVLSKFAIGALALLAAVPPASAATVVDAVGDFLPSYTGPRDADLDVISFSVNYNAVTRIFTLGAAFAGDIQRTRPGGSYIIGVNTGSGPLAPFASIGQGNVRFNQALTILRDGTGTLGMTVLDTRDIDIDNNQLVIRISSDLLPSTGLAPQFYGWNIWPRGGTGLAGITDFAPENALLAASPAPEPGTWLMMITGFGLVGTAMRKRRRLTVAALTS